MKREKFNYFLDLHKKEKAIEATCDHDLQIIHGFRACKKCTYIELIEGVHYFDDITQAGIDRIGEE
jgi:hypothetical protein